MASTQDASTQRAAYWPIALIRAIPAAACALVITFSADHSAHFGLLTFGGFAIIAGLVLAALAWRRLGSTPVRPIFLLQSAITVLTGILALVALAGGVHYLFLILTTFAALTGLLELYSGIRTRGRFIASGDWRFGGILTLALAVVFLLVPPEYSQTFTGPDRVTRVLDASVVVVGVFGAYAAIFSVYLLIAGLSAKWGTQTAAGTGDADAAALPAVDQQPANVTSTPLPTASTASSAPASESEDNS